MRRKQCIGLMLCLDCAYERRRLYSQSHPYGMNCICQHYCHSQFEGYFINNRDQKLPS